MKLKFFAFTLSFAISISFIPTRHISAADECWKYPASVSGNFESQVNYEYVSSLLNIHFKLKDPANGEVFSISNRLLKIADCTRAMAFSPYFTNTYLPVGITNFSVRFDKYSLPATYSYRVYNDDTNQPVNCRGCNVIFQYPVYFGAEAPHKTVITIKANDSVTSQIITVPIDIVGENSKNPLLIVPGIMGSELLLNEEKLWLDITRLVASNSDGFLDPLGFSYDGKSTEQIKVGDILANPNSVFNYSQKLISDLNISGYKSTETLFTFPYDWRKDIRDVALNELKAKIDSIIPAGSNKKMDIVAHSQGGLVVKYLLYKEPSYRSKIDKLILVGTPHLGAPKAAKVLLYGDSMGIDVLGLGLDPAEIKKLAKNMPSVYGLLPGKEYFNHKVSYLGEIQQVFLGKDKVTQFNYDESKSYLQNQGLNSTLLDKAEQMHEPTFDNFSLSGTGVKAYNIVGCEEATIGQIFYRKNKKIKIEYTPGDGTVPLVSASNFPADNTYFSTDTDHGRMLTLDGTRDQILKLIAGKTETAHSNITTDPTKCKLNGKVVSVHSPVDLHIYDQNGNHVGPSAVNGFDYNIEGVRYDVFGEEKFAYLPEGKTYTIHLSATGEGSFDLYTTNLINGNEDTTAYYHHININSNSEAEVYLSTDNHQSIELDSEGDGFYEQNIPPTSLLLAEQSQDLLPPTTSVAISGNQGQPGWYRSTVKVEISASDQVQDGADQAGVLGTWYRIDGGDWQKLLPKEKPEFTSEGLHTIEAYSADNAGNEETPVSINFYIDFTPPEAKIKYSITKLDIEVTGMDNLDPNPTVIDSGSQVVITDLAGNIKVLAFEEKSRTEKQKATLLGLSNNGITQELGDNKFQYTWSLNNVGYLSSLYQKAKNKDGFYLEAYFQKGATRLSGQDENGKVKTDLTGLHLLVVFTTPKGLSWSVQ